MNFSVSNRSQYQYKYLIFMSVFYFLGWVVSYPVVYKLIYIHHVVESSATLLFPLSYAVADIITEVYGYKVARQVVWAGVICGLIFSVALQLISYIPAASPNGESYYVVFGHITRIYASITVGSLIGNFLNIFFISKFKVRFSGRFFWARSLFSTAIGELTFTIIAGIMVWAGIQTWSKLTVLLLDAYLFKIIYALVATGPAALVARYLKKIEHSDVYDVGIDYNPFKLNVD